MTKTRDVTLWGFFFTLVAPDDYTAISSAQLVFPQYSVSGDMQCVDVALVDDGCLEPSENFTVSLSNLLSNGMASIGSPPSAVVNIEDRTGARNYTKFGAKNVFEQRMSYENV